MTKKPNTSKYDVLNFPPPIVEEKYHYDCNPPEDSSWLEEDAFVVKESFVQDFETADREGKYIDDSKTLCNVASDKPALYEDIRRAKESVPRPHSAELNAAILVQDESIQVDASRVVGDVTAEASVDVLMPPSLAAPKTNENIGLTSNLCSHNHVESMTDVEQDFPAVQPVKVYEQINDGSRVLVAGTSDYGERIIVKGKAFVADLNNFEGSSAEKGTVVGGDEEKTRKKDGGETAMEWDSDSDMLTDVPIHTKLFNSHCPQSRTLVRQVIYTIGEPLTAAMGPRELFIALRDITRGEH